MHQYNKNKKMIIKGAGKFTAKIPGCDELITLGTMQNMRLDIQLDMVDIEGGDTSVPLDTLLRKKTIDITAEDSRFDLNMVRLVLGSKLREGVSGATYKMVGETMTVGLAGVIELSQTPLANPAPVVFLENAAGAQLQSNYNGGNTVVVTEPNAEGKRVFVSYAVATTPDADGNIAVLEEKHDIKNGAITLKYGTTLFEENGSKTGHISIRTVKENKLLKQTIGNPAEHEYVVDPDTGVITFNQHLEGVTVYVNYRRTEVVDVLAIGSKDMPLTVTCIHDGQFEQKDGSIQGFQTELYACRVKSNFTIDATRQQASTHAVTLTVIDPERADDKLGVIKRYEIPQSTEDKC